MDTLLNEIIEPVAIAPVINLETQTIQEDFLAIEEWIDEDFNLLN